MIDKKALILAAAMVPMLNCVDVRAMPQARSASQYTKQHGDYVAIIDGTTYSRYDAINQTILINGTPHKLNEPAKNAFPNCEEDMNLGSYLRICDSNNYMYQGPYICGTDKKRAKLAKLGLYDGILNDPLPEECYSLCEKILCYVDMTDICEPGDLKTLSEFTWRDFIILCRSYKLAKYLNLFTTELLNDYVPDAYADAFCGQYISSYKRGKRMTYGEYFFTRHAFSDFADYDISIPEEFLEQKLPEEFISNFEYGIHFTWNMLHNSSVTWRELICFYCIEPADAFDLYSALWDKTLPNDFFTPNDDMLLYGKKWRDFHEIKQNEIEMYRSALIHRKLYIRQCK